MPPFFNYFIGIRLGGKKDHTPVLTNSNSTKLISVWLLSVIYITLLSAF